MPYINVQHSIYVKSCPKNPLVSKDFLEMKYLLQSEKPALYRTINHNVTTAQI